MSKRTNPTPSERARTIKGEFIDCRMFQHSWRPFDVHLAGPVYVQEIQCRTCKTTKELHIDRSTGEVVKRGAYKYPEGYRVDGGKLTEEERGSLRLISVRRTRQWGNR